jgi:type IV secretory pathway VirJ component
VDAVIDAPCSLPAPASSPDAVDAAPSPRRRRRLRRIVLAAVALLLGGGGYGGYRVAQMFGWFLPSAGVGTLPLVEVPAPRRAPAANDVLVVLLSADGGWARLDEELAARLSAAGYPVIGWNSLRYFMTPRSPGTAADDLSAVMRTYERKWHRRRVLLVGYSFGADVLPIVAAHLPRGDRAHVAGMVLLSLWGDAEFQFKPGSWTGHVAGVPEYATLPAARRIRDVPILCIGGDHDLRSVCARIGTANVTARTIAAGHSLGSHVDQVYALMRPMLRHLAG